jgi:hypothetical protein
LPIADCHDCRALPCAPEIVADNLLEAVKRVLDTGLSQS